MRSGLPSGKRPYSRRDSRAADAGALTIGALAAETGTTVQTIRYYEQIGVLPVPGRSHGNQRRYDERARQRLAFIRHARELGFPLEAVRELLDLSDHPERACADADRIARRQLAEVESRLVRLTALKTELARMIGSTEHGSIADCRVIETLSDHALCLHQDHAVPHDHAGAEGT
ncbi:MerR family transcriptional regulator [Zavarzinia sp. CC-PAN008]|uniref:MerR family transcriptional regulator n=1 Tax=Zavarzinia sp. CC-PAN008 TaxID=3243332 RepID=UPI003F74A8A3